MLSEPVKEDVLNPDLPSDPAPESSDSGQNAEPEVKTLPKSVRHFLGHWYWWIVRSWSSAISFGILLGGVAFLFLLGTSAGFHITLKTVVPWIPGQFTLEKWEGHLLGTLHLVGFQYENDTVKVKIDDLVLSWKPIALLEKKILLQKCLVRGVTLVQKRINPNHETKKQTPFFIPPISLEIQEAKLEKFQYFSTPSQEPFRLKHAILSGRWSNGFLSLKQLSFSTQSLDFLLRGQVQPESAWATSGDLSWTIRPPKGPAVSGIGKFRGNIKDLHLAQTISGKGLSSHLDAQIQPEALTWKTKWNLAKVDPSVFAGMHILNPWSGILSAQGTAQEATVELGLSGPSKTDPLWGGPWKMNFHFSGDWKEEPRLILQDMVLQSSHDSKMELHVKGEATLGGEFRLAAGWRALAWHKLPQVESPEGEASLIGNPNRYRFQLGVNLKTVIPSRLKLSAHGNLQGISIDSLRSEVLGGQIDASGKASWQPTLHASVALSGKNLRPEGLLPEFPGKLEFSTIGEGSLTPKGVEGKFGTTRLGGILRGKPLDIKIQETTLKASEVRITDGKLSLGTAKLTLQGTLGNTFNLVWNANIPNFADLWPEGRGQLVGQGHLEGTLENPKVQATLKGEKLRAFGQQLGTLSADVNIDPKGTIHVATEGKAWTVRGVQLAEVSVSGQGNLQKHYLEVDVSNISTQGGMYGDLSLELQGGWDKKIWRGQLLSLEGKLPEIGDCSLEAPVSLAGNTQSIVLEELCLSSRLGGQLCATGQWQPGKTNASVRLREVPIVKIIPKISGLNLKGSLNASLRLNQGARGLEGQLEVIPSPGELAWRLDPAREVHLHWQQANVHAELGSERLQIQSFVTLKEGGGLGASFSLAKNALLEDPLKAAVTGEARIGVTELGLISALVPALVETKGEVRAQMTFGGTLGQPRIEGEAFLEEGSLRAPAAGLKLQDMKLAIRGRGESPLAVEGQVRSGDGTLKLTGTIDLKPSETFPAHLQIQGENFAVLDLPEAKMTASPNLTLDTRAGQVTLNGKVLIPSAKIAPKTLSSGVQTASPDVVVVGRQKTPETARSISVLVTIELGKEVKIQALGLKTRLEGQVTVTENPGRPSSASGELYTVDGSYKAYGQDLSIRRGRLLFLNGPLENPGLDVEAVRTTDEATVGIHLRGAVQSPKLTLFSEPTMEQTQILAYLFTGHGSGTSAKPDASMILQAASSLGIGNGDAVMERLKDTFGLESIEVQQGTPGSSETVKSQNLGNTTGDSSQNKGQETSLVLGKYLSPRLYVSYGLGLYEHTSSLRLRYKLAKNWTLETEGGSSVGTDLLYTIEAK
ncbi:translocation and assembly module TamB [Gammaproteobacteria bacterium]